MCLHPPEIAGVNQLALQLQVTKQLALLLVEMGHHVKEAMARDHLVRVPWSSGGLVSKIVFPTFCQHVEGPLLLLCQGSHIIESFFKRHRNRTLAA